MPTRRSALSRPRAAARSAPAATSGDERVARELVTQARDELGRLDVLVNNAAFQQRRESIADVPTDEWERTLRTNLTGMFFLCREAIPHMEPGASIINTASIQAMNPSASLLAYATTKGGIVTFSKALSAECIGKRHPGQRRRSGPGVDAARRRDIGPREQRNLRHAGAHRPAGPARGARAGVRIPCLAGVELRHRPDDRRDRAGVLQLAAIRPGRGPLRPARPQARR